MNLLVTPMLSMWTVNSTKIAYFILFEKALYVTFTRESPLYYIHERKPSMLHSLDTERKPSMLHSREKALYITFTRESPLCYIHERKPSMLHSREKALYVTFTRESPLCYIHETKPSMLHSREKIITWFQFGRPPPLKKLKNTIK